MALTKVNKHKLYNVRSVQDFRGWWNTYVDIKVKAIVTTGLIASFVVVGFQYQVNALTNGRLDEICLIRFETREELTKVLYAMVDISDLGLDADFTKRYTESRTATIDDLYGNVPPEEDCA